MLAFKYLIFTLMVVGAINWGLVGAFNFDLVAKLFGDMSVLSRLVYGLVGLSGLSALLFALSGKCCCKKD